MTAVLGGLSRSKVRVAAASVKNMVDVRPGNARIGIPSAVANFEPQYRARSPLPLRHEEQKSGGRRAADRAQLGSCPLVILNPMTPLYRWC